MHDESGGIIASSDEYVRVSAANDHISLDRSTGVALLETPTAAGRRLDARTERANEVSRTVAARTTAVRNHPMRWKSRRFTCPCVATSDCPRAVQASDTRIPHASNDSTPRNWHGASTHRIQSQRRNP
ncbi:hypothetical protein GCM10027068_24870 [Prescottella soli]